MNKIEINKRIETLRTSDYVCDSEKNTLISKDTLRECGFSWRLRLITKAAYNLSTLEKMKKYTGAADLAIEYKRGLWVTLFFYPKK